MTEKKVYKSKSLFDAAGYVACGALTLIFLFAYSLSYYQLDYWQHYFYKDTVPAGSNCQVRTAEAPADNWAAADAAPKTAAQPVTVPHTPSFIPDADKARSGFQYVEYTCRLDLTKPVPELAYLHTGWVFGERVRVRINGDTRLDAVIGGAHKPIVPLRAADLSGASLTIDLGVLAKAGAQIGMIGAAPMVLAPSETVHNRLLSLEVSLQTVRYLYTFIPILILGLVLSYGWMRGIRSRMMLITLFFFTLAALKNLLFVFADLWPWNSPLTYLGSEPFTLATGVVLWLLIAEGLGLWEGSILMPMLAIIIALVVTLSGMALTPDVYVFSAPLNIARIGLLAMGLWVGYMTKRRRLSLASNQDWSRSYFLVLIGLGMAFWLVTAADTGFYLAAVPIRMGYKLEYILPLVVGYALIQNLLQINRKYERERKAREKIESDLETAREIQDSIAPPEMSTLSERFEVYCYQVKHSTVAGDWMAVRVTSQGIIGVVADATGKGVQAALVIHALQSLWAAEMDHDDLDVAVWLKKVNRTLLTLGKNRPHSMTLGIFVLNDRHLTYWSAGHLPLYVSVASGGPRQISAINARGSIIGIAEELSLRPEVLTLSAEGKVDLLLGTDGVFDKGTRSGRRVIAELFDSLEVQGEAVLRQITTDDDRTLILLKQRAA